MRSRLPRAWVNRVMGGSSGFSGILRAVLVGVPLPICSCGVLPIATGLRRNGGGGMQRMGSEFAEEIGDTAKVLTPKAFGGSSIKSSVPGLEAFVDERLASK